VSHAVLMRPPSPMFLDINSRIPVSPDPFLACADVTQHDDTMRAQYSHYIYSDTSLSKLTARMQVRDVSHLLPPPPPPPPPLPSI